MTKAVEEIDIPVPWGHVAGATKVPDKKHVSDFTEEKSGKWYCNKCNSYYINKSSLNRHIKIKHGRPTSGNSANNSTKMEDEIDDNKRKKYTCDMCGMKYDFKHKLLRHMKVKHESETASDTKDSDSTVWFKCEDCERSFILWKSLLRHYRINHPGLTVPVKKTDSVRNCSEKFVCNICQIEFFKENGLKLHIVKYHCDNELKRPLPKLCECSLCNYKSVKSKPLFEHYTNVHGIEIKSKSLNFSSYNEFLEWKENEEKRSLNHYVKQHGPRKYKNGIEIRYFYCHRSGNYKQKGIGKRRLKHQGTKKYGKMCPSRMSVKIINASNVVVDYTVSHVGHDSEVCHLTLSQNDRISIANKIAMKMTFDDILNEVRNGVDNNDRNNKSDSITRKDLHNIVKSFKLTPVCSDVKKLKKERLRFRNSSKWNGTTKKPCKVIKSITSSTNKNEEENSTPVVIKPSVTIESPTKSQLFVEIHDLVIIGDSISSTIGNNSVTKTFPVTLIPVGPVVTPEVPFMTSDVTLMSPEVPSITADIPLKLETSQKNTVLLPLDEEIPKQHKTHLNSEDGTIIFTSENFEEPKQSMTFEESKQNFINELLHFVNENVNNLEELRVAQELTTSFMDVLKEQRDQGKANFVVISEKT